MKALDVGFRLGGLAVGPHFDVVDDRQSPYQCVNLLLTIRYTTNIILNRNIVEL